MGHGPEGPRKENAVNNDFPMKCARFLLFLMPALALAIPAYAEPRELELNDSQVPGSVIVFPKFIQGTVTLPGGGTAPATEIEIGIVCPEGETCAEHESVKILFHWVCPGSQEFAQKLICSETNFVVTSTVFEKIVLSPDGVFSGVTTKTVPAAPCPRGYLIGWVIRPSDDQPIKFDGLIGDAVLRESGSALASYSAIPIQANPKMAHKAAIDDEGDALLFDGGPNHYQAVTSEAYGDIRYTTAAGGTPPFATASVTLLTLDVLSNRPNNPVFVPLTFYGAFNSALGNENPLSTFTEFVCWIQERVDTFIDPALTTTLMGRKGVVEFSRAEKVPFAGIADHVGPVTLLGLIETIEVPTAGAGRAAALREYITSLFNDGDVVPTCFVPSEGTPCKLNNGG
jgi:hypothetical protein